VISHAQDLLPQAQAELLSHLAKTGNLLEACALARTSPKVVRTRAKDDAAFAEAIQDAWDDYRDGVVIPEAHRRAVSGTRKGVYYRGELGKNEHGEPAYEHNYSDALLIRLLEVLDPRFRPHQIVESRPGPGPADLATLSPEARARMEALLEQLAKDQSPPATPTEPKQGIS
jgi:hypothetical protein